MEYNNIKKPSELLEFMNNIEYGFVDKDGKKYGSWNEEKFESNVTTKWFLSSPERLLKVGYGHCFDQVELERSWFIKHNYNFKTYYMMFLFNEPNNYSTHTFLVYEENNKWYLFEHSDYYDRGIHEFNTLNEALKYKLQKHIEYNRQYNEINQDVISHLHIYEYEKPDYNINFNEFIDNILCNGKDVTNNQDR